jgi:mannitol/fructose-specific phosphotransferase system IIA component
MPLEETIETYKHFLGEVDKLGLAYVQLLIYFDRNKAPGSVYEGKTIATPHDVLETYRHVLKVFSLQFISVTHINSKMFVLP